MKKSIWIVVALMTLSTGVFAQKQTGCCAGQQPPMMGKQAPCPMHELNLTPEQKAKIKEVNRSFQVKDSILKASTREQRMKLNQERQQMLDQLLTPGQRAKLDSLRKSAPRMDMQGKPCCREGQMKPMQGCQQMSGCHQQKPECDQQKPECCQHQMQGKPCQQGCQQQAAAPRKMGCGEGGCMKMQGQPGKVKPMARAGKRMHAAPVDPEVRIKKQVEHMTKMLELTPEQAAKIEAIQRKYAKKEIARYQEFKKKQDAVTKRRNDKLEEIKSVLTPEQVKKLEAMKDKGVAPCGAPMKKKG